MTVHARTIALRASALLAAALEVACGQPRGLAIDAGGDGDADGDEDAGDLVDEACEREDAPDAADSADGDAEPPSLLVISDLVVEPGTGNVLSFVVGWRTDRPASSHVDFGETGDYGQVAGSLALVTEHEVLVVGCPPLATIHLRARSTDEHGVTGVSDDRTVLTGGLPSVIPPIELDVGPGAGTQPGVTLMNVSHASTASPRVVLYLDIQGRVIWYWVDDVPDTAGDVSTQKVRGGNVLVGAAAEKGWLEVDLAGQVVRRGEQPPKGEGRIHHHTGRLADGSNAVLRAWYQGYEADPTNTFTYDEIDVFDPDTGVSVWSWRAIDHMTWPEFPDSDWTHANWVGVDLAKGLTWVNFRNLDAVAQIRNDTGAVDWMLGACAECGFALVTGTWFHGAHGPQVLASGNVLVYDNGTGMLGDSFSRVVEYSLDTASMTASQVWEYAGPPAWYTPIWGSVERLENGNTLVAAGTRDESAQSRVFEVTPGGDIVWSVTLPPTYGVYRASRLDSLL